MANPYATYVYNNRLPGWVNVQNPDVSRGTLEESASITTDKRQSTFNAEGGVIPIVYGRQRVGSKIFAVRSYLGYAIAVGYILCEGEVHEVESLEVNDEDITAIGLPTYGSWWSTHVGTSDQTADTILTNAFAGSTPSYTDTLPNTCYASVLMPSDVLQAFPRVSAIIKGKKVYDPRDANQNISDPTTWTYSDNPSLCLADLITSTRYGLGRQVNWASVANAANFNDKLIDGDPSRRLDIVIDSQQETGAWVETLRAYASVFLQLDGDTYTFIPDCPISNAFEAEGTYTCYGQINGSGADPHFDLDSANGFSFEITVKPTGAASQTMSVFAKGPLYDEDVAMYYTMPADATSAGQIVVAYTTDSTRQAITFGETLAATSYSTFSFSLKPDGTWLAAINATQITENGSAIPAAPITLRNTSSADYVLAKVEDTAVAMPFAGIIDEFRFWKRYRELEEIERYIKIPLKRNYDNSLSIHVPFNDGYDTWTLASGSTTWSAASIARNYGYTLNGESGSVTIYNGNETWDVWHLFTDYGDGAFGQYDFYSFNNTNILDGSVRYRKRGVLSIPTVVRLGYTDTSNKPWREAYATVDESSFYGNKVRLSNISMPGITRYSQAEREAWERLHTNLNDLTVTFTALDDALNINLGDGIIMHHEVNETRYTNLFKPYRVTGIRHKEWGKWDITAMEYDPQGYATTAGPTQTFVETNLPAITDPVAPDVVDVVEEVFQNDYGVWTSRLRITWDRPNFPYIANYKVEIIRQSPAPQKVMETAIVPNVLNADDKIEFVTSSQLNLLTEWVDGATPGTGGLEPNPDAPPVYPVYIIKIYTISVLGKPSNTPYQTTYEMQGKRLRPGNVPAIRGFEASGKVYLSWDKALDLDIWRYELRQADSTAVSSYSREIQWQLGTRIDSIDALTYIATNIPIGTRRFMVKAIDSLRQESEEMAYVDLYVDRDDNAFIVGELTVNANATECSNLTSFSMRPNPNTYWVTDFGGDWAEDTGSLDDPIYPPDNSPLTDFRDYVIPVTHTAGVSTFVSTIADFGAPTSGTETTYYTGNLVVSAQMQSLAGTVTYYIEASTDLTTWTTAVGTSANMTARYVRFRVETANDTESAFVINDSILIRFDVVAREESGSVTTTSHVEVSGTTTTTATYGLVTLTRKYAKVKSIQLTLVSPPGIRFTAYEDVVIGHNVTNTFKAMVWDSAFVEVSGQEVSYLFKGV